MRRHFFALLAAVVLPLSVAAQNFDQFFTDATLRIDYTFVGNANSQTIALDRLSRLPQWHGRRHRLSELPVVGNSQITVRDHASGDTIYRNSASTLFQEWITYPEAKGPARSFEHVCLVPMPKALADVTVELRDNRHQITASYTHTVDPQDILIRRIGEKNVLPYEVLQAAKDQDRCINVAFLAEGYTAEEMDTYLYYAREAVDALFEHEPFKGMRDRFNIIAVKSPSQDSGTSEPKNGLWRSTAVGSHFDTFYSDRYLTTLQLTSIHDLLAGTPYEHVLVLVNTEKYGGGGILNCYTLSMTKHKYFKQVVVHEFGHSFAGLGDEYAYDGDDTDMYPSDVEPWEENITTQVDFASKWKDMMGQGEVGLYEGAGYRLKGVYRPTPDCRMRSNLTPEFCPVCQRALRRLIDFYTTDEK